MGKEPRPYSVGDVLVGFGLANAGRYVTVLKIGRTAGRIQIERHVDGKRFWTFDRYYRNTGDHRETGR